MINLQKVPVRVNFGEKSPEYELIKSLATSKNTYTLVAYHQSPTLDGPRRLGASDPLFMSFDPWEWVPIHLLKECDNYRATVDIEIPATSIFVTKYADVYHQLFHNVEFTESFDNPHPSATNALYYPSPQGLDQIKAGKRLFILSSDNENGPHKSRVESEMFLFNHKAFATIKKIEKMTLRKDGSVKLIPIVNS